MSSGIIITVKMRAYLKDFILAKYGPEPIRFPKRSYENLLLIELINAPLGKIIIGNLRIELPYSDIKDPRIYNYMSKNSQSIFEVHFYDLFWGLFRSEFLRNLKLHPRIEQKQNIYKILEKFGVQENSINYESVKKHIYRDLKKEKRNFKRNFSNTEYALALKV